MVVPYHNLFRLGYGCDPNIDWSPLSLGTSLAAWYRADAGCYTDAACLFASASSQYLSKTSPTFAPTTKMTIRFSIKPDGFGASKAILGRFDGADNQFLVYQTGTGAVALFVCSGATDASNYAVTTETLVDATRADVVIVYDGTLGASARVAIYINGVAATMSVTGTIPTSLRASSATLSVGAHSGASEPYNGAIARLGFSSLVLSGAALTAAHTSTFWADMTAARQADWFSFYNLCEASSTRVDSTGLNNLFPGGTPTAAGGHGDGLSVNNSNWKRQEDVTTNLRHLLQSTVAQQLLYVDRYQNGRPALKSPGDTNQLAQVAANLGAQPVTIWWALKTGTADGGVQWDGKGTHRCVLQRGVSVSGKQEIYAGSTIGGTHTPGAWHVYEAHYNGASSYLKVDGATVVSGDAGAQDLSEGFTIGNAAAGGAASVSAYGEGFILTGRAPAASESANAVAYLTGRWLGSDSLVVFEGDSITAEATAPTSAELGYPLLAVRASARTPLSVNFAVSGSSIGTLDGRSAAVDGAYGSVPAGSKKVLSVFCGANDSANTAFTADLKAYCLARKAAVPGLKIVIVPILPNTVGGFNTWRNLRNAEIVADPSFYDAISAQPASMYDDAAASNTEKYSDGVHPTEYGQSLLAVPVQAAIDSVLYG